MTTPFLSLKLAIFYFSHHHQSNYPTQSNKSSLDPDLCVTCDALLLKLFCQIVGFIGFWGALPSTFHKHWIIWKIIVLILWNLYYWLYISVAEIETNTLNQYYEMSLLWLIWEEQHLTVAVTALHNYNLQYLCCFNTTHFITAVGY